MREPETPARKEVHEDQHGQVRLGAAKVDRSLRYGTQLLPAEENEAP